MVYRALRIDIDNPECAFQDSLSANNHLPALSPPTDSNLVLAVLFQLALSVYGDKYRSHS